MVKATPRFDETDVEDYTTDEVSPHPFRIGKDVFVAIGEAPAGLFLSMAEIAEAETQAQKVKAISSFFEGVLEDDSLARWNERFHSKTEPISLDKALKIFGDLVGKYTDDIRPTEVPAT